MKKIGVALLFVSALFAILFAVFGVDSSSFTISGYLRYISENIKPFPKMTIEINNLSDLKDLLVYPFALLECVFHNIGVFLYGLFPIDFRSNVDFGSFGGGGFGGGLGGAR